MESKTKLAQELGDEALEEFLAELTRTTGLTSGKVRELAAERGIEISRMASHRFLKSEYEPYLDRVRRSRSLAQALTAHSEDNVAGRIADAAAGSLGELVFSTVLELESTGGELDERLNQYELLSKTLQRLRSGDVARDALNLRVKALEDEKAERARLDEENRKKLLAVKERSGLSDEAQQMIEMALGMIQ
jgi:hypothetical protein